MYDAQQIFRQKRRLSSTKKGIVHLHTVVHLHTITLCCQRLGNFSLNLKVFVFPRDFFPREVQEVQENFWLLMRKIQRNIQIMTKTLRKSQYTGITFEQAILSITTSAQRVFFSSAIIGLCANGSCTMDIHPIKEISAAHKLVQIAWNEFNEEAEGLLQSYCMPLEQINPRAL